MLQATPPMTDLAGLIERLEGATEWRQVPDWPYEASREGVLRSMRTGRALRPTISSRGYERVTFQVNKKRKDIRVHRAIYEAWFGPIPKGMEINHLDGNKRNNAISNLEACTGAENMRHAAFSGLMARGKRNGVHTHPERVRRGSTAIYAKLTEIDVLHIKKRLRNGERLSVLSAEYGVDVTAISQIKRGVTWRHVD